MKWINPRDLLPSEGELIWILIIDNREGERCGKPSARIAIAQAIKDRYGVISVEEISYKGYPCDPYYFFEWCHYDQSDSYPEEKIPPYFPTEKLITAWRPFDGLPEWDFISIEESKQIIMSYPEYHQAIAYDQQKERIRKSQTRPYFIRIEDEYPLSDGIYVVANKNGAWLSRYEKMTCNPWIAPDGQPVLAWYPVPNSF